MRAWAAGRSLAGLGEGWWEGGKEGGKLGSNTDVREPHRYFTDTANLWAVSGKAGGLDPRAAQPENGLAPWPPSRPGLLWKCWGRSAVCRGPHERFKAGEPLKPLRRQEEKAQEEAEDTPFCCLGRLRSDSCCKPSPWIPQDSLCCLCTWS